MANTVSKYAVVIHGSNPANSVQAQIDLLGAGMVSKGVVGRLYFYTSGVRIPADKQVNSTVLMHLPIEAFAGTLALLQHDRPLSIALVGGRGKLASTGETVGETES